MTIDPCPPVLVEVTRDGVVEAVHRGHVAVCAPDGRLIAAAGEPRDLVYVRSTVKAFQVQALLDAAAAGGIELEAAGIAIACASHTGADDHQIEAAHLLALAGLDEEALQCPPDLPSDLAALRGSGHPTRLAHNCSGKHAGFLLAQVLSGRDPARYLDGNGELQRQVADHLGDAAGMAPVRPGVDGCGAPAWQLPLSALATAFARLAAGDDPGLRRARDAMHARPDLVGGAGVVDTMLMAADGRVVAKRGAEGLLAIGALTDRGPVGIVVKVSDGAARATGPAVGPVLAELGITVPTEVRAPVVLGGGRPHGELRSVADLRLTA
jgi:L-asparaginase II